MLTQEFGGADKDVFAANFAAHAAAGDGFEILNVD